MCSVHMESRVDVDTSFILCTAATLGTSLDQAQWIVVRVHILLSRQETFLTKRLVLRP